MPQTTETRICDRPGCGATFTPSGFQRYSHERGMYRHIYCSQACKFSEHGKDLRAAALHPPASSYSDEKLVAEMRERTARGLPMVWPVPGLRAPTEGERASTAA